MVRCKVTGKIYDVFFPQELAVVPRFGKKHHPDDDIVFLRDKETKQVLHVTTGEYASLSYENIMPDEADRLGL